MANEEFTLYRHWLSCGLESEKNHDIDYVQESFRDTIQQSPAYQSNAYVNGELQPIVATRKETKKCDVTVLPGDTLHIGDLVHVFNEYWICVELYIDEYGMRYGELWMCNQIFAYQDYSLNIIQKHAILDDGSYSKGNDKAIMVTDNSFNCYISLDSESEALFVDKRLAIAAVHDSKGNQILEVGKIKWIDVKSKNFGEGSHLMVFGINDDAYSPENDDLEKMICDYREAMSAPDDLEIPPEEPTQIGKLIIGGRSKLRIGSGRTYKVSGILNETSETVVPDGEVFWSIEGESDGISITPDGCSCKVTVKENDDLIGLSFQLKCECISGEFAAAEYLIEVL